MTRRAEDVDARLADALALLETEIGTAIVEWRPSPLFWRSRSSGVEEAVIGRIQLWIALCGPRDAADAKQLMWPVFLFAVWAHETLGELSFAVLVDRNVENWAVSVLSERSLSWAQRARGVLRRVGRAANPAGWPPHSPFEAPPAAAAYSPSEEYALRLAAGLPGRPTVVQRLSLTALTLGAGMRGSEAVKVRPCDLVEMPHGRLAVRVAEPHPRLVPVRGDYTDLIRSASAETGSDELFIPNSGKNAPYTTAQRIEVVGLGTLSLSRARSTWLTAHLAAGTPLAALRVIAGPLSANTLSDLMAAAALMVDPGEAAKRGLGA
ncbi:MAG: hypothetical protein OXM01_13655 [Gemmatimonadota bacterium]|nr:hypothetical protein [Gemmatimonadota bacterium]